MRYNKAYHQAYYQRLSSDPARYEALKEYNRVYNKARRKDPIHSNLDELLKKWDKSKVYINKKTGYVQTEIYSRTYYVHQLVWMEANNSFIPKTKEINHKDLNKLNNDISNLELVTHQQNLDHYSSSKICINKKQQTAQLHASLEYKEELKKKMRDWHDANKNHVLAYRKKNRKKNNKLSILYYYEHKDEINAKRRVKYYNDKSRTTERLLSEDSARIRREGV